MKTKFLNIVTNAEYALFDSSHSFPAGHENKPATKVSFDEAVAYAKWLSKRTGRRLRLPTEGELSEAEKTFKADFSSWPLNECPDVGTVGSNHEGVRDLRGVVYTWTANDDDVARARQEWSDLHKSAPVQQGEPPCGVYGPNNKRIVARLEAKIEDLEESLSNAKIALNIVRNLG